MSDGLDRFVEFVVHGLAIDKETEMPILLLRDWARRLVLPIWIGRTEASAIISGLEDIKLPRPSTHDLLTNVISAFGGQIRALEITAIEDGAFLGVLKVTGPLGNDLSLDCRPSDGVAVAVRFDVPIRIALPILDAPRPLPEKEEKRQRMNVTSLDDEGGLEQLKATLASMEPDDFGEFET